MLKHFCGQGNPANVGDCLGSLSVSVITQSDHLQRTPPKPGFTPLIPGLVSPVRWYPNLFSDQLRGVAVCRDFSDENRRAPTQLALA